MNLEKPRIESIGDAIKNGSKDAELLCSARCRVVRLAKGI